MQHLCIRACVCERECVNCALSLVKSACCSFLRLSTWSLRLAWSCLVGSFNYFTWIAEKMFITSSESLNKTLSIMGPMKMASEDARSFFFLLLLFFFFSSAIVGYMNFDFNFGIDFCHWVAFSHKHLSFCQVIVMLSNVYYCASIYIDIL